MIGFFRPSSDISRPGGSLAALPLLLAVVAACTPGPGPRSPAGWLGEGELAADSLLEVVPDSSVVALEDSLPPDESLLTKILRSHPPLRDLNELYTKGGAEYFAGHLDLSEEYFYLLKEKVAQVRDDQPDSLALLYVGSLERKLDNFIGILSEERFFSESYAPVNQSLTDAFDSLRTRYGLPDFLVQKAVEPSSFERELLLVQDPKIDSWIHYFEGRGHKEFQRWLDRQGQVGWIVERILEEEQLPRELVYLAMIESGLRPTSRSRAAAVGYWQFVRGTARNRGLVVNDWLDERRDIEKSTRAACRHLKMMYGMFQDWPLALAAYNAGEYRIQRAIGLQGDPDYWELRLPRETREYVPKFLAAVRIGSDPGSYGFVRTDQDTVRYDTIELDDTFSLDQIAKAAQLSERTLRELNPQLLSGITPPRLDHVRLRVPLGKGKMTLAAVNRIPEKQRITWRKHRVRAGETLGALARRYRTSARAIMDLNGITNPRRVRAGRVLTIPYPRGVTPRSGSPRVAKASTTPVAVPAGKKAIHYRVRSGDTLSTIAERHGISIRSIRRANHIRSNRIEAGRLLTLHVAKSFQVANDPFAVSEDTHERTEYRVRPGDTLGAIGRRFGVDVAALLAWNDLPSNGRIRPGERILIWRPRSP